MNIISSVYNIHLEKNIIFLESDNGSDSAEKNHSRLLDWTEGSGLLISWMDRICDIMLNILLALLSPFIAILRRYQ